MDEENMKFPLSTSCRHQEWEKRVFHFLLLHLEDMVLNDLLLLPVALCNRHGNFNGLTDDVPNSFSFLVIRLNIFPSCRDSSKINVNISKLQQCLMSSYLLSQTSQETGRTANWVGKKKFLIKMLSFVDFFFISYCRGLNPSNN